MSGSKIMGQDEFESQLPGADEWDGTPPDVSYDR